MLSWFKKIDSSDKISVLLLFCIVLTVQIIIALMWQERNVFSQFNIIFDSDPNRWTDSFAFGWGPGGIVHPLGNYLISLPIWVIDKIGSTIGLVENSEAFKLSLVPYIAPLFTALKSVCIYTIFRVLRLDPKQALLISCIAILSFSSIVFGSVPSFYPLVGFGYALLTLCTILLIKNPNRITHCAFYLASLFNVGMALVSIIYVGWMRWFQYLANEQKPLKALTRSVTNSAALMIGVVVFSIAINQLVSNIRQQGPITEVFSIEYLEEYVPPIEGQIEKALRFPEIMARTILPTVPVNNKNSVLFEREDPIKVELSYIEKDVDLFSILYSLAAIIVFGGGGIIALKQDKIWKTLILSSIASIVTFWVFFAGFGLAIYLYSQHWHLSGILLIGVWLKTDFFKTKLGQGLLMLLIAFMFLGDLYVLDNITQRFVPSI